MHATQAWETLNDPDTCARMTMGDLYAVLRRAGYSEDESHRAAMRHGWDRLSAGKLM